MVQNSVKYNLYQGDVLVVVTCKPMKRNESQYENFHIVKRNTNNKRKECMLETVVIDSGIGISLER
jgi:hypothetical protein